MKNEFEFEAILLYTKNLEINSKFKHLLCSFMQGHKKLSIFLIIPINQIDTCHTTNISKGGWFIRLFKKHLKLIKKIT